MNRTIRPAFIFATFITLLVSFVAPSFGADPSPAASGVIRKAGTCSPTQEICGDGVDQDCDGKDLSCSGGDKDRDGYPDGSDCDPTNRRIYPGVSVSCSESSGAGTQTCQENGSFTPCAGAPLCEATAGGTCYYVSQRSGSDSNPGTFAAPWATYKNIVTYGSPGERPAAWKALQPGDVVYFLDGRYEDSVSCSGITKGFSLKGVKGTAAQRVVIKAYPGAAVTFSPKNVKYNVEIANSEYVTLDGIEIADVKLDGLYVVDSNQIELRNLHVHNVDGLDNNNLSGIKFNNATNSRLHHSFIHDNYDRTNADTGGKRTPNSRNVVLFDGGNIRIDHNVIFQTTALADSTKGGACVTYKHAATLANSSFEVDHNILWNCFDNSIGSGTFNTSIHHNLIYDSDLISIRDFGHTTTSLVNVAIENNTIVNGGGLGYNPVKSSLGVGPVTFRRNIVIDNRASYAQDWGIIRVHPYGSDDLFQAAAPADKLIVTDNCYYNFSTPPKFALFAYNGGDYGTQGGNYSFPEWQQSGRDSNSYVGDPKLDTSARAAEGQCADKGWVLDAEESGKSSLRREGKRSSKRNKKLRKGRKSKKHQLRSSKRLSKEMRRSLRRKLQKRRALLRASQRTVDATRSRKSSHRRAESRS